MKFLNEFIINFENQKNKQKQSGSNLGVVYTPNEIADFIVKRIFKIYINDLLKKYEFFNEELDYGAQFQLLVGNQEIKSILIKNLENLKILDPSCGSGRFLISAAKFLFKLIRQINNDVAEFDLKKSIIQSNIYGVDIDNSSCIISKLRLLDWLYSDHSLNQNLKEIDLNNLNNVDIEQFIKSFNIQLNVYNLDYLLEFDKGKTFDIIIGNPPYIENKKFKNSDYKKQLYKKFYSAYRLFDTSVVFLEKSLEHLKDEFSYLSFLMTNKFLAADYGVRIRELLIKSTELKEIINISSLPIFYKTATYPVIFSLKKGIPSDSTKIIIKSYSNMEDINKNNGSKTIIYPQKLTNQLPSNVIPISGNIELINYLYSNCKSISETFSDLKIIYRPYGFLNYSKYFDNVYETRQSEKDLLLIGTGNVGKYHIKYKKRIKIAKRDIKVSYFKYKPEFQDNWDNLSSEKLIFREIAKDLTCSYDPGIFTNITGLYFMRIPSINTEKLFSLLTILNSNLINSTFKTLFGTLHMSGGYLRFNGSFIKRLPMPEHFPISLSNLGKIFCLLSQLEYEIIENSDLIDPKSANLKKINKQLELFLALANSLVYALYFEKLHQKSEFPILYELLYSKNHIPNINFKFIVPQLPGCTIFNNIELKSVLSDLDDFFSELNNQNKLIIEMQRIWIK